MKPVYGIMGLEPIDKAASAIELIGWYQLLTTMYLLLEQCKPISNFLSCRVQIRSTFSLGRYCYVCHNNSDNLRCGFPLCTELKFWRRNRIIAKPVSGFQISPKPGFCAVQ